MDDITINNVVIHELVKEQHQAIRPSNIRTEILDSTSEAVGKLVLGITSLYGKRNNTAHYGTFRNDEGKGIFPDEFHTYAGIGTPDGEQFLNVTNKAMTSLYGTASLSQASSGGYMLFSDYSNSHGRYFLAAMIKQKEGITLSELLEPEELMQLDLNRLYQAARISFAKLSAYLAAPDRDRQDMSYLSFVSPSSTKSAAGYFVTALGCAPGAAAARATDTLIRESVAFFREHEDLRAHRASFKTDLVGYLGRKEEAGESVKLSEIENLARPYMPAGQPGQADEIADAFIAHLNSEECAVPVEFPVSKRALAKHTHIDCKAANWELKFQRIALGEDDAAQVYYDRERNRIIINEVPRSIVEAIDAELNSRDVD